MKPLSDFILIEKEESVNQIGLVLLPDTRYVNKSKACRILAVGRGLKDPDYEVGKRCLVLEYDGIPVEEGKNLYLVKPDEIWAIIDDNVRVEAVRTKKRFSGEKY